MTVALLQEEACDPATFYAALLRDPRGIRALGIDRAPEAVCCDVFGPVPGVGGWAGALLVAGRARLALRYTFEDESRWFACLA